MNIENEDALIRLLGEVVKTNQQLVVQNERFIEQLRERDVGIPERNALAAEREKLDIAIRRIDLFFAEINRAQWDKDSALMASLDCSREEWARLMVTAKVDELRTTARYRAEARGANARTKKTGTDEP
jgi:hypothetical protein